MLWLCLQVCSKCYMLKRGLASKQHYAHCTQVAFRKSCTITFQSQNTDNLEHFDTLLTGCQRHAALLLSRPVVRTVQLVRAEGFALCQAQAYLDQSVLMV